MLVNRCNLCLPMLILSLYRPSVGVRKDWWFVAYLQLLSSRHHLLFAGPPRLYHKITGYGSTWVAWDTWTTLKVRALSCLWSFIAHSVSQSIDDSHLRLRSYCLQIRPRLCCIFSLCSHRPSFFQRQSPSTTTMVSLSLTSSTPPMPFPSSSPSFHHSTTQLEPSESGEHR